MTGKRLRFSSERRWLMVLVAAVLAPLAVFQAMNVQEQRALMLDHERENLERAARVVSQQMAVELNRATELLASLAAVPELGQPGHPDCGRVIAGVAAGQRRYTNFSVVDRTAHIVCSSGPLPAPVFVGDQSNIGVAFETGGLGLSDFKLGKLTGRPVIVLSQPLRGPEGHVIGTLNNGLSLDWLQDTLTHHDLPRRGRVVVFNQDGLVLAASDPAFPPGSLVAPAEVRHAQVAAEGTAQEDGDDDRLTVYQALSGLPRPAYVAASVPNDAVVGRIDAQARVWFITFTVLTVLSLGGVYLVVDRLLLRRLVHLSDTARRFAAGDYGGEADRWHDRTGLSQFGRDLDAMAEDLEAREKHLRQTLQDMAKARAETARFAYIAAHDLQEPLRAIGGFTQLLGRRLPDDTDPQVRHYMNRITVAAERMRTMFKELMDYAVLDSSHRQFEPVDLTLLVQAAAERHAGVAIETDGLPVIGGNTRQIARLIDHLIDNAVLYAHPDRPPHIVVTGWPRRGFWEISVRDNGIGIPAEAREAVFHLFKKLDPEGGLGGTGTGLSIARRIAEIHGGRMWISAAAGVGCDIRFTLSAVAPVVVAEQPAAAEPAEATAGVPA